MYIKPSWKIGTGAFALAALLMLLVVQTHAEVVLLDAESGKELSAWKSNSRRDRLTSEARFATRGNCSLQFTVASYALGVDDRECVLSMKPEVTDWRDYESLVLDIFNPGDAPTRMRVQIETSADDARGLGHSGPLRREPRVVGGEAGGLARPDWPKPCWVDEGDRQ